MSNSDVTPGTLTFAQILELSGGKPAPAPPSPARSSKVRLASKEERLASGHIVMKDLVSELKLPIIPPTPAKPKSEQVKKWMTEVRISELAPAIGAMPRDHQDRRATSNKHKSLANFTSNEMTFTNFGKDGEFFNMCKQYDGNLFKEADQEEFYDALKESLEVIGSSGSMEGLLTRLKIGMLDAPVSRLNIAECVGYANSVLEYNPIELNYSGKSVTELIGELDNAIKFNPQSSGGVPYFAKVAAPGVMYQAVENASLLLNSLADGSFSKVVTEKRPSLMAVLLKNKQDYYEVSKLGNKIRPYFVYPLHERLLYSVLQATLKPIRFDEKEKESVSCSAVGFSWNYGGGDKMYEHVRDCAQSGYGFYPVFYGDDQLWVIVTHAGDAYVFTPDFSHMDLSLSHQWGQVAYKVWRPYYHKLDKTWESVLKLNCKRAFIRQVIVDGALAYQFKHGLGSGVPGTTKFDEVASAAVNGYIKEKYRVADIADFEELRTFLFELHDDIKNKFGLVFKEGSMKPYLFTEGQDQYGFMFLGQTLVRLHGALKPHYVPRPSQARLVISATTYKKSYRSPLIRQKASMSKYRSLYAGGGYLWPILADRLESIFRAMEKRGIRPIVEEDDEYKSEVLLTNMVDVPFEPDDRDWPTSEWAMNLFLPPDDSLPEGHALTTQQLRSSEPSEHGGIRDELDFDLDDFDMDRIVDEAINPTSWHDQALRERVDEDKGKMDYPDPKKVKPSQQGRLLPLPDDVKKQFEADQQALRDIYKKPKSEWKTGSREVAKRIKSVRSKYMITADDFEAFEDDRYDDDLSDFSE